MTVPSCFVFHIQSSRERINQYDTLSNTRYWSCVRCCWFHLYGHNWEQHLWFLLQFTPVDREGRSASTSLHDKRDDFNIHVTHFPFLSSNIPSSPAYGVYLTAHTVSQDLFLLECFILRVARLHISLSGRYMSGDVLHCPSGSSMVAEAWFFCVPKWEWHPKTRRHLHSNTAIYTYKVHIIRKVSSCSFYYAEMYGPNQNIQWTFELPRFEYRQFF